MYSVTARIKSIKQPRGGYIKPSEFEVIDLDDGILLNEQENVHSVIVGMAVDYLTRFVRGADVIDAFHTSAQGALLAEQYGIKNAKKAAIAMLTEIDGIDDNSVINACKLVTFDVWFRNPMAAAMAKGYAETNPDKATIQNIQTLVKRSVAFFEKYGEITKDGFSFEPEKEDEKAYNKMIETGKGSYGGYTATVSSGDGDFLTSDTLWDFKVSKNPPTNKHTLQLLMYWIMGQHSGQKIFRSITKLGLYNPRLNKVYLLDVNKISKDIIAAVEKEVICYE